MSSGPVWLLHMETSQSYITRLKTKQNLPSLQYPSTPLVQRPLSLAHFEFLPEEKVFGAGFFAEGDP